MAPSVCDVLVKVGSNQIHHIILRNLIFFHYTLRVQQKTACLKVTEYLGEPCRSKNETTSQLRERERTTNTRLKGAREGVYQSSP